MKKNTGVYLLLQDIVTNGITEKYYQWASRVTFNKHKNDPTWFGGFCQVIWSFGNSQKDYLYAKDLEPYKYLLHRIIVYGDREVLKKFERLLDVEINIPKEVWGLSFNSKRLQIMRLIKTSVKSSNPKSIERSINLERLNQLQNLVQLNQLQDKLVLSNLSYDEVTIDTPKDSSIVYLDPPYRGVKKYAETIDIGELDKYISRSEYKVYLSEYESPFAEVMEMEHRSTLSATNNKNKTVEKLYTNKKD